MLKMPPEPARQIASTDGTIGVMILLLNVLLHVHNCLISSQIQIPRPVSMLVLVDSLGMIILGDVYLLLPAHRIL